MEVSELITPCINFKNEYLLNGESNFDEKNPLYLNAIEWKCGEIVLLANADFWFVCTTCDERFHSTALFQDHIKDLHLTNSESDPTYNDPLDFPQNEQELDLEIKSDTEPTYGDCSDRNHDIDTSNSLNSIQTCKEMNEVYPDQEIPAEEDNIQSLDMYNQFECDNNEIEEIISTETKKEASSFEEFEQNKEIKSPDSHDENLENLIDISAIKCGDINVFDALPKKVSKKTIRPKKVYSCSYCQHIASCNRSLENHLRSNHGTGSRHQCEACGKCFGKKYYLQSHMITHSGERPYKCDLCEGSFAHPNTLKSHREIHTGRQRSYSCNLCDKKFISKNGITYHMRDHTGETPFVCVICERKFTSKSQLNKHMIDHSGRLDFICEECGKAFKYKEQLTRHKVYHTNEKKFVCDLCPHRFAHKKNLLQHKKIHSDVKQYTCKVCGKEFAQYPGLYSHMKYHRKKGIDDS